ncbi:Signal transduction histidine kinase internal region domain-containing protein [Flavobacterium longum]|uniref:tetratricopeptide repeat protein n=1 Tax=Flavobacterium longum TaxID=1299340 RepID=UPI0039E7D69C
MKNFIYIAAFLLSVASAAQTAKTDSLTRMLKVVRTDSAKANLLNKLSVQWREISPDSAMVYAKRAAALSQKNGYDLGAANAQINLGNTNIILGNYRAAKAHFESAKQMFENIREDQPDNNIIKIHLARACASLGVVYSEESNYYLALEHYQKAAVLYQDSGENQGLSKVYNNMAVVYKSQQNYSKALEFLKKALPIQQQTGESTVPVTLTNIGAIHAETGQWNDAFRYYQQAEKLFKSYDNPRGFALLTNYLGDYHRQKSHLDEAEKYYRQSLSLNEQMQHKFGAALALYNLGQLYFQQKRYAEALPMAEKSLAYANQIGVLDQTYHSEKLLSDLYHATGKPNEAFAHYKNYIAARDSITNLENTKKLAQAEMKYDYQKKEALLNERNKRQTQLTIFAVLGTVLLIGLILLAYNRRQVKKRLTLEKEVAEYEQKALHLQMNPHFVFNCLSSISSFIVQNGTDQALKYLSKFSKLMRLTLEYSKDALIPIDKEIESLQNYLELEQLRFHNKFTFNIQASDNVEFNMGLPPLLVQPFVENAILHGVVPKDDGGKIEIYFDVEGGQLTCTVTDNGIGLQESKTLKEHSVTAHKSMALDITRKRLDIMETTTSKSAQIEITDLKNENKNGTRVKLRLPVQYIP